MSALSSLPLEYRKVPGSPNLRRSRVTVLFAALLSVLCCVEGVAQRELHVAAATDLRPVMPALAEAYEHATGIKLIVTYGSSSAMATQVLNGAPFDLFFAADFGFPEKVVAAGLSDMNGPASYARGTLVLWARKDSPLQPLSLDSINTPQVTTISMADDANSPYGVAVVRALQGLHEYDKVLPKMVKADNNDQAAQFAESGKTQLAFISLTLANSQHMKDVGSYVFVPMIYPPISQCAITLKKSAHLQEAHDFLNWILSSVVQTRLREFGLNPVSD